MASKKKSVHVKFEIKNSGKGRVRGTVYGIAEFVTDSNEVVLVASHKKIDTGALNSNQKMGTTFGARKLTHKRLSFTKPNGINGAFKSMRVVLNEDQHSQPLVHTQIIR